MDTKMGGQVKQEGNVEEINSQKKKAERIKDVEV